MSYNKEEKASIWKLIKNSLFVGAFGILTAWIIFPFAWTLRRFGRNSILWWWMDDDRRNADGSYSADYLSYIIRKGGVHETFKIAYLWHTRNSVWNLKRKYFLVDSTPAIIGNNNIDVVSTPIDGLVRFNSNGTTTKIQQDGVWIVSPGLKYIPLKEGENIWQVNQGDNISYKTSVMGEGMIWFYSKGKTQLQFRYGHCKNVIYRIFGIEIWSGWRTIKLGYGNMSHVMTVKHQKIKPWL